MLNFTYSLLVSTALLSFMPAENSSQVGRSIGGCKGIKNTDIEEVTLLHAVTVSYTQPILYLLTNKICTLYIANTCSLHAERIKLKGKKKKLS